MLLAIAAVQRYAIACLWCAYAVVASAIIFACFWKSAGIRPFKYIGAIE